VPRRIFHERGDYNRADSFLAWRAAGTDNAVSGGAREGLVQTQEFLTTAHHGTHVSKRPSTAGRAREQWAGKGPECTPGGIRSTSHASAAPREYCCGGKKSEVGKRWAEVVFYVKSNLPRPPCRRLVSPEL